MLSLYHSIWSGGPRGAYLLSIFSDQNIKQCHGWGKYILESWTENWKICVKSSHKQNIVEHHTFSEKEYYYFEKIVFESLGWFLFFYVNQTNTFTNNRTDSKTITSSGSIASYNKCLCLRARDRLLFFLFSPSSVVILVSKFTRPALRLFPDLGRKTQIRRICEGFFVQLSDQWIPKKYLYLS